MRQKICTEKQNTLFMFNNILFFFLENLAMREIMWKHFRAGQATDENMAPCALHAGTSTHLEYVILTVFLCSSGCMNTTQCYLLRTFPVL